MEFFFVHLVPFLDIKSLSSNLVPAKISCEMFFFTSLRNLECRNSVCVISHIKILFLLFHTLIFMCKIYHGSQQSAKPGIIMIFILIP